MGPLTPAQTPGGVEFRVEEDAYTEGDTITLTLGNDTAADVGFTFCDTVLERRRDDDWEPVDRAEEAGCLPVEHLLPLGLTTEMLQPVRAWMREGVYRCGLRHPGGPSAP